MEVKISIYHPLIQQLMEVKTKDCWMLASLLVSRKRDFIEWMWLGNIDAEKYGLSYITGSDLPEILSDCDGDGWNSDGVGEPRMLMARLYAQEHFKRKLC